MNERICIYCDESCHLENDGMTSMVLGALWCPWSRRKALSEKVKALKATHGIPSHFEIKWVKVSPAKLSFYKELIDLFFNEPLLNFRGLVVPDKQMLDHEKFKQTHDEFYYKQWFLLLDKVISPEKTYKIFLDIKDTRGRSRADKLHDILCNANYDFDRNIIEEIELAQSHHVPLLQVADLLIGALAYAQRGLRTSKAKLALVEHVRNLSGLSLSRSSLPGANKYNLFVWRPQI